MIRFGRLPKDIHERIDSLSGLFQGESNIIFAYLFGGLLRERKSTLSDVDIAVFVRNMKKLDHLGLFAKITDMLHTDEVDLVVLNNAPLSLAGRILANRRILIDKEPFVRYRYESTHPEEIFRFYGEGKGCHCEEIRHWLTNFCWNP
ncbi:MAG: type VII toxin-antitoxin system MntA family adenylyltransferase antitoxin [bacterium]